MHAVHEALTNPDKQEQFTEISATTIANNIRILQMLQEEIFRDGTLVKSETVGKHGLKTEYKLHPAFKALPKMISDMGFSLDQFV